MRSLIFLLLTFGILTTPVFAIKRGEYDTPETFFKAISDQYLRSFPVVPPKKVEKKKGERVKMWKAKPPELSDRDKNEVLLNKIFMKSKMAKEWMDKSGILNEYSWDDLRLLYGSKAVPGYHLLSRLPQTKTTFGNGVLALTLITPTRDQAELEHRQNILKHFYEHPEQISIVQKTLKLVADTEVGFLSFWSDADPLFNENYQEFIDNLFYFTTFTQFNTSSKALEVRKRFVYDFTLATYSVMGMGFLSYALHKMANGGGEGAIFLPLSGLQFFAVAQMYDVLASPVKYIANRLLDCKNFLIAATLLDRMVASDPALEAIYGEHMQNIRKLLNTDPNTDLGLLVHNLQSMPLHSWSIFFNNNGDLFRTYKLFLVHRDDFIDAFYDLGMIDAYSSVAQLLNKNDEGKNGWVFAKYLNREDQASPKFSFQEMWNPFLDAKKAMPNSLEMDAQAGDRNLIVTGPNAGGKSTFINGTALSVLLAQTIGLVPAKEATLTTFDYIGTYVNLSDDIAEDRSLFMAEVLRAQKHLEMITKLDKEQFSFSIMDEIFSGTNPKEGEAAAFGIAKHMGHFPNSLNIVASHFPKMTLLESYAKEGRFANFRVLVDRDPQTHRLKYPFKVVRGKSNQTIAIDLMEEQNISKRVIEYARDIIQNPEKYKAEFN